MHLISAQSDIWSYNQQPTTTTLYHPLSCERSSRTLFLFLYSNLIATQYHHTAYDKQQARDPWMKGKKPRSINSAVDGVVYLQLAFPIHSEPQCRIYMGQVVPSQGSRRKLVVDSGPSAGPATRRQQLAICFGFRLVILVCASCITTRTPASNSCHLRIRDGKLLVHSSDTNQSTKFNCRSDLWTSCRFTLLHTSSASGIYNNRFRRVVTRYG